jgi:hypothetical protein
MTVTQTEPPRRKLSLSRETVRCLGGASFDGTAAQTGTTLPAEPDVLQVVPVTRRPGAA